MRAARRRRRDTSRAGSAPRSCGADHVAGADTSPSVAGGRLGGRGRASRGARCSRAVGCRPSRRRTTDRSGGGRAGRVGGCRRRARRRCSGAAGPLATCRTWSGGSAARRRRGRRRRGRGGAPRRCAARSPPAARRGSRRWPPAAASGTGERRPSARRCRRRNTGRAWPDGSSAGQQPGRGHLVGRVDGMQVTGEGPHHRQPLPPPVRGAVRRAGSPTPAPRRW